MRCLGDQLQIQQVPSLFEGELIVGGRENTLGVPLISAQPDAEQKPGLKIVEPGPDFPCAMRSSACERALTRVCGRSRLTPYEDGYSLWVGARCVRCKRAPPLAGVQPEPHRDAPASIRILHAPDPRVGACARART